jgi:hypothetical protein
MKRKTTSTWIEPEIPFEDFWPITKTEEVSNSEYTRSYSRLLTPSKKLLKLPETSFTVDDEKLSKISVTSGGVIEETWTSIQKVPSRIIEISDHFVILECLVDISNRTYEHRKFDKADFETGIPLKDGQLILIKISSKPLKKLIEFIDGTNLIQAEYFKENDLFKDLKGKKIFRELR